MHRTLLVCAAASLLVGCTDHPETTAPAAAFSQAPAPRPSAVFQLVAPIFGLDTSPDGSLLAAQALVGVTELRQGGARVLAEFSGISGVAAVGRGEVFIVTGEPVDFNLPSPHSRKLFRVSQGRTREIADFWKFEQAVNPDQIWNPGPHDSNPFDVAHLHGGTVLVADAGGNSVLIVDERGTVDWVAVLTPQPASTTGFKTLIGCFSETPPPTCGFLPDALPAEPVPTSVAVGPDGAWYVGELTGFPGTPGISRVWRIAPNSRRVVCPSAACTVAISGLTSVMDLSFGPDGTLYVVEFDADGWLAAALAGEIIMPVAGGRVKACSVATGSCTVRAQELPLPTAVTVGRDGTVWVAENDAVHTEPHYQARIRAVP
jgi:hypothetical protein